MHDLKEQIAQTIKALGWRSREDSSAVADALLPLVTDLRSTAYREGQEDMRERAAKAVETIPYEHWEHWEPILTEHAEAIRSLPL